jgi:hypothetical protein
MDTVCSHYNAPMSCDPGHGCWCSDLPHALQVSRPRDDRVSVAIAS